MIDKRTANVAAMFNDIAPRYDFLNHFLSLGIDKWWRKRLVCVVSKQQPKKILDVATGTGDVAFALQRKTGAEITGIDISEGMLAVAQKKHENNQLSNVHFQIASAEALPFADGTFDAVTVAFGVRNFEHLDKGLQELHRVLRAGGTLAVLEFATPTLFPVKQLYALYFRCIVPLVGRLFSKHRSAYSYLPVTVGAFPQRQEFTEHLQQAGFVRNRFCSLSCGIALLYVAQKE